jgi:beta-lactam-binding protein with PASTA domain
VRTGSFNLAWRKPRPFDEPCSVPDVRGDRMASARRRLLAANCLVGRVVRRNSEIVPRARVIAQYPFPGARLPILGRVHLEISSGLGVRPSSSG